MSLLGHSQSFSKGHDSQERCLSTGGKQILTQSSKQPKMSTQGIIVQAASPQTLGKGWDSLFQPASKTIF